MVQACIDDRMCSLQDCFISDTNDLEKLNIARYSLTLLTLADMAADPNGPVVSISI